MWHDTGSVKSGLTIQKHGIARDQVPVNVFTRTLFNSGGQKSFGDSFTLSRIVGGEYFLETISLLNSIGT